MKRTNYILACYFSITGLYLLIAPMHFYTNTPGVSIMGSFNLHFIRDIGFIFLVSGGGLFWGTKNSIKSTAIIAASWPFLHALFHLQIWMVMRNFTIDLITLSDFLAVIIPGFLALYSSSKIEEAM